MSEITIDVWLYGQLARYGDSSRAPGSANQKLSLPEGSTMQDLLAHLKMPTDARGITFINGELSAMPGLQPDLNHVLRDNDRVALFDLRSMWPFQYRHGVKMIGEMSEAMLSGKDLGLHSTYK